MENIEFNFEIFNLKRSNYIKNVYDNTRMLSWFIGFAEANGCFYGNIKAKRYIFMINKKDPEVLFKIRELLGFGKFTYYPKQGKEGLYRFVVTDQIGTLLLVHLFNGNLFLEKSRKRFQKYLAAFNATGLSFLLDEDREHILYKKTIPIINLKNYWLSGFIDAKGEFEIKYKKEIANYDTCLPSLKHLRFRLTLKDEYDVSFILSNLLNKNLFIYKYKRNNKIYTYHRLWLYGTECEILFNYLCDFFLYTKKGLDFLYFLKMYTRIIDLNDYRSYKSYIRFILLLNNLYIPFSNMI